MSKHICFYNHWHNGDVFSGKGWMQSIMAQHPEIEYVNAHPNHAKIMADVGTYISTSDLPSFVNDQNSVIETESVIYVNTWIGLYGFTLQAGEIHANWLALHKMWKLIAEKLNTLNGMHINFGDNVLDYVAETDWDYFDIGHATGFLNDHSGKKHLFCNGAVRSTQSNLDNMQSIIESLATTRPNDTFICTADFETVVPNIYFTNSIFNLPNDLNEIAYLGTQCDTVVGKNSGPFMFAHIKESIMDNKKTFISLSHRVGDSYACNVTGLGCQYFHCSSDDTQIVLNAIDTALSSTGKNGIVTILD